MNKWRILAAAIAVVALSVYVGISWGADPSPLRVYELNKNPGTEKIPVISGVAVDPAGKFLATAGDDHVLRIWNINDGAIAYKFNTHSDWIKAVTFQPDGKKVATACDDRRIRIWDLTAAGNPVELPEQPQAIHALAYSPDGQLLATAGFDDKVRIYTGDGRLPSELDAPGADIGALAFSPDGTQLAAAGRTGTIRIWDVTSSRTMKDIQASARRICALAYSPDGRQLAAAGDDRAIRLMDPLSGKVLAVLPEQPAKTRALQFCDKNLLASSGTDNVIRLWNLAGKTEQEQLIGHTGTVCVLAYNPQTGTLISAGFDTTARAWKITNQNEGISQR